MKQPNEIIKEQVIKRMSFDTPWWISSSISND